MNFIAFVDFISALASLSAVVIIMFVRRPPLRRDTKMLLAFILILTLFHGLSNLLERSGITAYLDAFEGRLQILEPLLWCFFIYGILSEINEGDIRKSEHRYRTLYNKTPVMLHSMDTSGRLLNVNDYWLDLLGYKREEVISRKLTDFLSEESRRYVEEIILPDYGKADSCKDIPCQLVKKDGEVIDVLLLAESETDDKGMVVGLLAMMTDVTERNKAEKALRKSEQKYRDLVEDINEVILTLDINGTITYVSAAVESLIGIGPAKIIGHPFTEFIHPEDVQLSKERFQKALFGNIGSNEYRLLKKTGEIRWIVISSKPLLNEGHVVGLKGVLSDITGRKQTEEAFRESEEKYRILIEHANDAIFIAQDEVVKFPNPKALEMTGYTSEELAHIPFVSLIHPEDRNLVLERHRRRLAGETLPTTYSFKIVNKAGEILWVQLNTVSITWEGRTATLNFIRDITNQKKLEAQFQQAQKMEAIGTLAGGIAHDFNNLLMAVQGNTSLMLLHTEHTHPNYTRLKNIEKQVESGSKLTKQLLGYARKGAYDPIPINLNRLVEETSETFGITNKDITIHLELAENICAIEADQGQIEQVLLNLYVNSVDAMPNGGELFIQTINVTHKDMKNKPYDPKPGKYVLLKVRDTGMGMDKETRERIFDPFFTTKEMGRGTGLGLASVYGIIKAHGGYIDVQSEKTHGTTFHIYLPGSKNTVKKIVSNDKQIIRGTGTILLVDDESMVLDVGVEMLKHLGYSILKAKEGKEAIEIYLANKDEIDLVILDMIMPGMGGGDVYDKMKEINPHVRVLLSSGFSINGQATEILQRGCDGFIQKPFNIEELSAKIKKLL